MTKRPQADWIWEPSDNQKPPAPLTSEYARRHTRTTMNALASERLIEAFRSGSALPSGYGVGLDERLVEFPWLLAHRGGGPALDAGSTLNHAHVLEYLLGLVGPITISTLRPEENAFTQWGVSYVYSDLRDLPLRDDCFATVACISTLEHVGMDNRIYGDTRPSAKDPDHEMLRAIRELIRVTQPGGAILITVPYGKREDHGWLRQFDNALLAKVEQQPGATQISTSIYAYSPDGWQISDREAAAESSYFDMHSSRKPAKDGAVAARAVACIKLRAD